jgi:hypothetical protein
LVCGEEVLELSAGVFEKLVVFYRFASFKRFEVQRGFGEALFEKATIFCGV